jgi:poly(3-hydroxyalkanoate) synthetase
MRKGEVSATSSAQQRGPDQVQSRIIFLGFNYFLIHNRNICIIKYCKHDQIKFQGHLWGGSAWTAENSDFQQALTVDLGSIKNVTGIATQVKYFDITAICDISFTLNKQICPHITITLYFNNNVLQGRQHSDEYVMEYMIQYGTNGKDFSEYKEVDGNPKLFRGNEDGDYVSR